jgi:hypothetical protein
MSIVIATPPLAQICNHECSEEIILNNQIKGLLINKLLTAVFHSGSKNAQTQVVSTILLYCY